MASLLGVCIPGCMCTGGGIHYRGCTFITGGVASTSAASTTGGCTFITGGVHTRTHVYWGWHPLQGVYLHNWGVGIHTCCIHYKGGVPSSLGVCIPGHMCTGGVPSLQPVKNIYSLELKQRFVYETIFIKIKVHRYDPSGAYGKTCN